MKTKLLGMITLVVLSTCNLPLPAAPLGTAFTYQGRLSSGGNAAIGFYDFQFKLFDALTGGVQQGSTVTVSAVGVSNGLFTATVDFGSTYTGSALWLQVATSTNGAGSFTTLTPRQALTATPYASYAPNAGAAATANTAVAAQGVAASAVTAAGIASGQVVKSLNGLRDAVALAAGPNVTLATNANTLTISAAGGGASGGWTTTGNAGTTPAANFLGTTDGQPLVLKAARVGVNTNNPQATLHVNGTVLANRFAGDGSGLTNVPASLAAPFTLNPLAITNNGASASGVAVSGRYAYLANGYDGLRVYDLADPAHPVNVGHDTDFAWGPTAVVVSGSRAYAAGDKLYCVDISSPANPVTVGSSTGSYYGAGVAVSGNTAYVAADTDGLFTYSVANPTNPISLGHIDNGGSAQGVAVSGNFAYLANDTDGLRIYNVANPAAPVHIARIYNNPTRVRGVAVSGNLAYLANDSDGLRIYNVANPTNPVSVSQTFDAGYAYGVTVSGNYAFVANFSDGLRVYDVSDPAHPKSVGVSPPSGDSAPQAVAVSGNYAYTADALGGLATYFAAPVASVSGVVGATGFLGDGSSLSNLNASQLVGQIPASAFAGVWQLGGNAGTTPGTSFLGTTDNQPLEFRVNNQPLLCLTAGGSLAMGTCTNTSRDAVALGKRTAATADAATAMGEGTSANGASATAMGYGTHATGDYSTTAGYGSVASGPASTALGNGATAAGMGAFAAGTRAAADHRGTFVWADSSAGNFTSTGDDQFLIRAAGGVAINKVNPAGALDVNGTVWATGFRSSSDVSFNGVITSGPIDAHGNVSVSGNLSVLNDASVSENLNVSGDLSVLGNLTAHNTPGVNWSQHRDQRLILPSSPTQVLAACDNARRAPGFFVITASAGVIPFSTWCKLQLLDNTNPGNPVVLTERLVESSNSAVSAALTWVVPIVASGGPQTFALLGVTGGGTSVTILDVNLTVMFFPRQN